MELLAKFDELKQNKKSNELIDDLHTLLSLSKKERDYSLTMQILQYLIETLRYLRLHDKAVILLETEINEAFFTRKDDILKIIDELVRTLLRTEDFLKLKSILFTRERFLTIEHQKVMQKFYLAVCHEGLKDNKLAIDNLLSIKDNISNSNLVSKYLKLSMLYLKENQLKLAKEYFNKAVLFEPRKNNPIFYLTESDILYMEGDFQNALVLYQEYFIKSKNKRRYLDRYILINIKLNRVDEAWRFYQEYLPTIKGLVSRNYRLIYYEAAKILAKELNNTFEEDKLDYLIQELEPNKPALNQFDNVYRLLTIAFKNKRFLKVRDIIHSLFSAIDSLYHFQKMLFVTKNEEGISFYHYSKGLLLEKNPKINEYSNTIFDTILSTNPVHDLYTYDDLNGYSKELYKTVETSYVFVNGIKREESFNYFVIYSKDIDNFDFQQKLILIANEILKKQLNDFDVFGHQNSIYKNYQELFNKESLGFIKIEKGIIHLLNMQAKSILGTKTDYLAFEEFQNSLVKKVFIDDFLYTDQLLLEIKDKEMVKSVVLNITKDEYIIYATMKIDETHSNSALINHFMSIGNESKLLDDCNGLGPLNIILFDIRNYLEYFKDYNYHIYKDKLGLVINTLKSLSRTYFNNIYLESFNIIYLTVNTVDKRVIKRIVEGIYKEDYGFDIRASVIAINNSFNYDDLVKLRYLNSITSPTAKYIFDNKNFRYNVELAKTILLNVNNLLNKKVIPLEYIGVGDWLTNEIRFLSVNIAQKAMLGEAISLNRVLKANELEINWDYLAVSQLIKNLKKNHFIGSFIINISIKSLEDPKIIKRMIKRLESHDNSLANYYMSIDFGDISDYQLVLTSLNILKEKNIGLIGTNFIKALNVSQLDMFKRVDYLILEYSDLNNDNLKHFLPVLNQFDIKYILNHASNTLKRSELEQFNIKLVYGDKFSKYENINALK